MKPLKNCVIFRPTKTEQKQGSIILPGTAEKLAHRGIVVAVGSEAETVKVGDNIILSYEGHLFLHDGEEHGVVKEVDILAILEKKG